MTFLYFGGILADLNEGRCKIGITHDLHQRAKKYSTGSAPSNGFSFVLVVEIESNSGRDASFWEKYFLNEFPKDENTPKNLNYFCETEFRLMVDLEKVKNIMVENQLEDIYKFYDKEEIKKLFQKREAEIISGRNEWTLSNLLQCFHLPSFNRFQNEALKVDKTEGIFRLPTGTGKFLIGLGMILKKRPLRTLWIAPRNDILNEQYEKMLIFSKYFNIRLVKCYGGNAKFTRKSSKPLIFISNPQSLLGNLAQIEDLVMLIYDEVQYLPSDKFGTEVGLNRSRIKYFYGFSATPFTDPEQRHKLSQLNLPLIFDRNFIEALEFKLVPKPQTRLLHSGDIWGSLLDRVKEWELSGFWRWALYLSKTEDVDEFYVKYKDNKILKLYYSHSNEEKDNNFPDISEPPNENELLIFCERGRVGVNIHSLAGEFIARDGLGAPHIIVQILGRSRKEVNKDISFFTVFLPPEVSVDKFGEQMARGVFEDFEGTELFDLMDRDGGGVRGAIKKFKELIDSENNFNEEELLKLIIRNTSKDWYRTLRIVRSLKFETPEEYKDKAEDYGLEKDPRNYKQWVNWWEYLHYPNERKISYAEMRKWVLKNEIKYENYEDQRLPHYPSLLEITYGYFGENISSFDHLTEPINYRNRRS